MNRVLGSIVACSALMTALSACAVSEETKPDDDPTTSVTPRDPMDGDTLSQSELDAAVSAMPDTSDFTYVLDVEPLKPLLSTEGTRYADSGWAASTAIGGSVTGEVVMMRSISSVDQHWMQLAEWTDSRRGCWLPLTLTQAPVGLQALQAARPVPYALLEELTATEDGYTAPFGLATQLLTVQAAELLQWNTRSLDPTAPVPVEVTVSEGVVTGLKVEATDLLDTYPIPKKVNESQVAMIRGIDVLMSFADGQSFDAGPPKESEIVQPGAEGCVASKP